MIKDARMTIVVEDKNENPLIISWVSEKNIVFINMDSPGAKDLEFAPCDLMPILEICKRFIESCGSRIRVRDSGHPDKDTALRATQAYVPPSTDECERVKR